MFKQYQSFVYLSKKPVSEDDFTLFRVLGRGGFGQVNGTYTQSSRLLPPGLGGERGHEEGSESVARHQSERRRVCYRLS